MRVYFYWEIRRFEFGVWEDVESTVFFGDLGVLVLGEVFVFI